MLLKVTIIDDSKASQQRFIDLFSGDAVMQSITMPPFFDEKNKDAIKTFMPDVIILDLLLEESVESGFRVLKKLKESEKLKDIPVIVVSKFISPEDPKDKNKLKAEELGAVIAMSKFHFPTASDFIQLLKSLNLR